MSYIKVQIGKPGCGIAVYEQDDYYTDSPTNRFVSYNPSTGYVIFNAIEDGDEYTYLFVVSCTGIDPVVKTFTQSCTGSVPTPTAPSAPSAPSAVCTPNYAIAWSWGTAYGGTAVCNDSLACDYTSGHVGSTAYVSINNLAVGGRLLKTNCTPFVPTDATFTPDGCNVITVKRLDLAITYAVIVINNSGYITDIHSC